LITNTRSIIKNILKGRTCSNCARSGLRDDKHCSALKNNDKNSVICSQWMMSSQEKWEKQVKHRKKVALKRKQRKLDVKNKLTEEISQESKT